MSEDEFTWQIESLRSEFEAWVRRRLPNDTKIWDYFDEWQWCFNRAMENPDEEQAAEAAKHALSQLFELIKEHNDTTIPK